MDSNLQMTTLWKGDSARFNSRSSAEITPLLGQLVEGLLILYAPEIAADAGSIQMPKRGNMRCLISSIAD